MRAALGAPGAGERASAQGQPGAGLRAGGIRHREGGARGHLPRHRAQEGPAGGQVMLSLLFSKKILYFEPRVCNGTTPN